MTLAGSCGAYGPHEQARLGGPVEYSVFDLFDQKGDEEPLEWKEPPERRWGVCWGQMGFVSQQAWVG